jgi:hypothetical protein
MYRRYDTDAVVHFCRRCRSSPTTGIGHYRVAVGYLARWRPHPAQVRFFNEEHRLKW